MTSRELYDRVGGFRESDKVFWQEDRALHPATSAARLRAGRARGSPSPSHRRCLLLGDHDREGRVLGGLLAEARAPNCRQAVLVRVPFVRRLNARFGWFVAPT